MARMSDIALTMDESRARFAVFVNGTARFFKYSAPAHAYAAARRLAGADVFILER